MARDKVDELYEALAADGIVTKGRDNFREYFFAPKEEGYRNRKALYDALKSDGLVDACLCGTKIVEEITTVEKNAVGLGRGG